ncbi:MAG: lysylphosphatidylglycerol synthase transmembrane domain-containing protein [Chloroflexi bacterium]|nr:lysylphosphatidylglycerol synthase transmembrane domain-containing protein [Chloroflexota bacterium]
MSDSESASPPVSRRNRGSDPRNWFGSRFQIWFGLALGLGTLYLALRGMDFGALVATLRGVHLPFVALTLVTSLLTVVLKAVRWNWLLYHAAAGATAEEKRPTGLEALAGPLGDSRNRLKPLIRSRGTFFRAAYRLRQLSGLIVVGQAVNFYVPTRLGELVRAYLTGEETGVSKAYALGTIAAEKLIDLVMLAALTVALLPFLALPPGVAGRAGPLVLLALALCTGAVALLGARRTVVRLVEVALRWLPPAWAERWRSRIIAGLDGLAALGNRRAAAAVWGWTFVFWLVAATTNYLLLLAFDLPPSPLIALFLLAVLQGGIAVPSTPGKIGVFHYLCQLSLSIFGVPATIGFSYGLVLHVLVIGGVSLWAVLVLWRRSWNLRRLAEASAA